MPSPLRRSLQAKALQRICCAEGAQTATVTGVLARFEDLRTEEGLEAEHPYSQYDMNAYPWLIIESARSAALRDSQDAFVVVRLSPASGPEKSSS